MHVDPEGLENARESARGRICGGLAEAARRGNRMSIAGSLPEPAFRGGNMAGINAVRG
jgi:hypothetical protein